MYHNARNDLPTVSLRDIQSLYTTMSYTLKYDGTMTGTVAYTLSGSSSKGGLSIEVKVILAQLGDMQPVPDLNKMTMSFQGNLMEFYTTIFSLSAKEKNYWSAYSLDSSDHLDNVFKQTSALHHHFFSNRSSASRILPEELSKSSAWKGAGRSSGLCPSPGQAPPVPTCELLRISGFSQTSG
ncbi:unnamed protein product [Peronospora belbahrii]|uniref:Uncharacterized protein n=1 Tax=Peronospora belbahrii TaxID=622444 RepID=A0ABN8CRX9_9STRA|nr:unnamed protein product [Peronospora belbahrii]